MDKNNIYCLNISPYKVNGRNNVNVFIGLQLFLLISIFSDRKIEQISETFIFAPPKFNEFTKNAKTMQR